MDKNILEELNDALLDAYRSKKDLEPLVRFGLGKNLHEIDDGKNLKATVFDLLEWAEAKGRTMELVRAAVNDAPQNPALNNWYQKYDYLITGIPTGLMSPVSDNEPRQITLPDANIGLYSEKSTHWYGERIIITVSDKQSLIHNGRIPYNSQVEAPGGLEKTLSTTKTSLTWEELTSRTSKKEWKGTYWIEEIEQVAAAIALEEAPEILTSTFRGHGPDGHGRIFRPVLLKAAQLDEATLQLHFYFNQVIVPELVRGPGVIGELFNLLRVGTRMRWEVIEPFLKYQNRPEKGPEILDKVSFSLRLIELEVEKYNILEEVQARNNIFNPSEQQIMDELLDQHARVKSQLKGAIAAESFACLMDQLKEAREVNIKAMELASRKYHELLVQDFTLIPEEDAPVAVTH